ncbi:MAG: hypothetical protein HYY52_01010 [Candidatus Melainabacteria bacterium]|nr:hypothetical protein [Candidatus Melainabacteria bacterium]
MSKIYKQFKDKQIITLREIKKQFPEMNHRVAVKYLLKTGYLEVLKRGVYLNKAFQSPDKFLLAHKIIPDGIIGYHAALELHGLAQSSYNIVHIITDEPYNVKPFTAYGINYKPVKQDVSFGKTKVIRGSEEVIVTDIERTLIDCIDKLKYAGGLEEYFKSISSESYINEKKIIKYLKKYDKVALYHKVDFVLEYFKDKWNITDYTLKSLLSGISLLNTVYLDPSNKEIKHNPKWNLYIPKNFEALISS